jgi:hypothetical protein
VTSTTSLVQFCFSISTLEIYLCPTYLPFPTSILFAFI